MLGSCCCAYKKPHPEVTLYLVRHGEAAHNIREAAAKEEAASAGEHLGLARDSMESKDMQEKARQDVLNDASLYDAPLSGQGKADATAARRVIEDWIKQGMSPPTCAVVSPLQRALTTTNMVFPRIPGHHVHVREALRERRTGKPCDEASPSNSKRMSFKKMSWVHLRVGSASSLLDAPHASVEGKEALRVRTAHLVGVLLELRETRGGHSTIGIVSHKGYLRELERGPFGQPNASEFGNCEIRAYQVTLNREERTIESATRLHPPAVPPTTATAPVESSVAAA